VVWTGSPGTRLPSCGADRARRAQDTLEPGELDWLCERRHKPQAVSQVLTQTLWRLRTPDYQRATIDLQARFDLSVGARSRHQGFLSYGSISVWPGPWRMVLVWPRGRLHAKPQSGAQGRAHCARSVAPGQQEACAGDLW